MAKAITSGGAGARRETVSYVAGRGWKSGLRGELGPQSVARPHSLIYLDREMERNARTLTAMLDALAEIGFEHAVFGGLLAPYYGRKRATADVDVLVPTGSFDSLSAALRRRGYDMQRFPFLLRIYPRGEPESAGDFVGVESHAALQAAFAARTPAEILGLRCNAVKPGAFVALKFEAAVRPKRRSRDRALDVNDMLGVLRRQFGLEEREARRRARGDDGSGRRGRSPICLGRPAARPMAEGGAMRRHAGAPPPSRGSRAPATPVAFSRPT